ncbi:transcription antitermination factor NusB [Gammaproteobacteria bacterium LSUCC0057]|uniref:Transcription antitermination protein NusB n=1 Tax=Gammaproteobacteria bacterium LSUCC0057 TaxID=2559237 RepID=A0A4Y8UG49_9GAMM|nr:transcription antitermination factor NusB [Gammaproteobacteria bacterium LSUCC0057]
MATPKQRQKTRRLLVQALYSWELGGSDLATIEAEFHLDNNMAKADAEFFHEVLHAVPKQLTVLDDSYAPHLDRTVAELDPISRAVLRLASYELAERLDVPYKVVINEGVNLAKTFGPTDAYKYINGVLDKVAGQLRRLEVEANRR